MQRMKFAAAALLPLIGACQARVAQAPVASVSETSICQIDTPQSFSVAPEAGQDDPGNRYDTDATIRNLIAHNARLAAACPKD